jgi:hypothetical protein
MQTLAHVCPVAGLVRIVADVEHPPVQLFEPGCSSILVGNIVETFDQGLRQSSALVPWKLKQVVEVNRWGRHPDPVVSAWAA